MTDHLPRVALIALGGTIASVPSAQGEGAVPTLDAAALRDAVPGIDALAAMEVFTFRQMPGVHLASADLIELARFITSLAESGVAGVVVTQGTDTIEETAFALDLQIGDMLPVVVTGAMRGPSEPGADGPANVLAAVRVAISKQIVGAGVVVVMDDTVHAARWVRKMHSSRPSAFFSPMTGPLGWITEDRVTIAWIPPARVRLTGLDLSKPHRVALISTWLGDDGALIRLAADADYDALVIQAMGGGHVNPVVAEAIADSATRIPVVLATRAGSGETLRQTYGFIGSERDLIARGAIPAGPLDAAKARLLLELLLLRSGRSSSDAVADFQIFAAP